MRGRSIGYVRSERDGLKWHLNSRVACSIHNSILSTFIWATMRKILFFIWKWVKFWQFPPSSQRAWVCKTFYIESNPDQEWYYARNPKIFTFKKELITTLNLYLSDIYILIRDLTEFFVKDIKILKHQVAKFRIRKLQSNHFLFPSGRNTFKS